MFCGVPTLKGLTCLGGEGRVMKVEEGGVDACDWLDKGSVLVWSGWGTWKVQKRQCQAERKACVKDLRCVWGTIRRPEWLG